MGIDWTEIIWKLIIAVAPIVVSIFVSTIQRMLSKLTLERRERIEYWVTRFVEAAQMIEPDPYKRKEWVLDQICRLYPGLDRKMVSVLIESILTEIKNTKWEDLPPKESRII